MTTNISKGFMLQSKHAKNEKNYWLNKLSGRLMKTYFPYDHITQDVLTGKIDGFHFRIQDDLFARLIQLARGSDNNLYIVLLTCLNILLNKYTGNKDIITAIPIYKQEIEGEFINTALAIRLQVTGQETVKELIILCKNTVFEANEYLNFPIERLINDHLDLPFPGNGFSLLESGILLENIHYKRYIEHLKPNILFSFLKAEATFEGCLEYNSQLYKKDTIERIVGHFIYLLQKMLNNLDQRISRVGILSGEERHRLLATFNETGTDFPKDRTIHELFEQQVEKSVKHIAIVAYGSPVLLTYRELNEKSNQLGRILREKGVTPGTITAVMTSPSVETMIAILAVLKAGGAYLPIDPQFPQERIDYMLTDSRTRIVLTGGDLLEKLTAAGELPRSPRSPTAELINIEDNTIYNGSAANLERLSTPPDIVYVIYTSGTSGRPKGVLIKNENLVNYVYWFLKKAGLTGKDRSMLISSFAFDLGYTSIYPSILAGGELHIMAKEIFLSPVSLLDYLEEKGITYLKMTPSLFSVIASSPGFSKGKCSSLRLAALGGEPINTRDVEHAHQVCPHLQIMNHYGPTETTVGSIARFIDFDRFEEYKQKPTIGKPIANTEVYILDENLNPVPAGIPAELFIGGSSVGTGYLNQPELTAEKFIELKVVVKVEEGEASRQQIPDKHMSYIYKTGDMARWTLEGDIEFLGRSDSQVKIRGFRIELEEIENQLLKHVSIKNAVVVAREDGNGSKYLCAYYVSSFPIEAAVLREYLAPKLPAYMIPSFFTAIEKIPVTANGKADLRALPEPHFGDDTDYMPPQNKQQEKLAVLWGQVLGIDKENISIDANFFEMGGDSLRATTLIAKIHKEYNTQVPMLEFFKTPTIMGLSEIVSRSEEDKYTVIEPMEAKEYYPVSSVQRRLYLLQQIEDDNTAYNLPFVLSLEGDADLDKFKKAFKMLLSRHESLRTSFEMVNEELVQRIHQGVEFDFQYRDASSGNQVLEEFIQDIVRPFDLSCAPLMRAGLIKTAALKYIFWVDMHHILRDGQSERILKSEFMAFYAGEELPPLRLHYKDYSEWQNSQRMQEVLKRQEKYWRQEFSGEIPVLNLPMDYPRPPSQSFEGNFISFELNETETTALNGVARTEGTTVFMILLALFYVFLSKISHQENIVMGIPIAARTHADLGKIIGMLVNTLVIRTFLPGNSSFTGLLNRVKDKALQAFDNQDYSFEKLVENVSVERDLSRNPMFDVMFVLQNISEVSADVYSKKIENLLVAPYPVEKKTSKFDLTLIAVEGEKKLLFHFEYCSKLFKNETIRRFIKYFKKILSYVLMNPKIKISEIEIIPDEEKKQILSDFNNTGTDYPQDKTIHQLFEEQVKRIPDQAALIGQIPNPKSQIPNKVALPANYSIFITYRELNERSDQLAYLLKTNGVENDAIVGIMVDRSIEMIIGIMGILKAGGAYLPIAPDYPEERKQYMIKDSGAKILLIRQEIADLSSPKASNIGPKGTSFHLHLSPAPATSLAYVIYTSGSTGQPKGVVIQHGSAVNRLHWMQRIYPIGHGDIILQKTPYTFDVSVWELFWWSFYGARLCLLGPGEEKDPCAITNSIQRVFITTMHFVPSMLNVFLDYLESSKESYRCVTLRQVFSSGEALGAHQVERFYQLLQTRENPGTRLINLYGPTEAAVDVTYYNCTADDRCQTIPIGKPIDNISLYILDEHLHLQPIGIAGELCIAGIGLARGYLNHPQLTAVKFCLWRSAGIPTQNHMQSCDHASIQYQSHSSHSTPYPIYRSGDLARWLPDGNIEFLGRIDHQVKLRGFRIELGEIETRLSKHPEIKESVVLMREDQKGDKYLCAYYVSDKEYQLPQLWEYLSKELPDYMMPSYFMRLEKIPLTSNGKLDRKALPEPSFKVGAGYVAPRNKIEKALVEVWKNVLNRSSDSDAKIGINDNFFHLGGNSLKATILTTGINKELDVQVPLGQLFKTPTIKGLSEYIQNAARSKFFSIECKEKKEYYVLSSAQKRLYILQQFEINSTAYNMPHVLSLGEDISKDKLEETFRKLIYRYESLRTSYELVEGIPVQRVHNHVDFKVEHYDLPAKNTKNPEEIIKHFTRSFDLSIAPLLRVGLIKKEEIEYILIIDLHHIITDGISQDILIRDFESLYAGKELLPLRIQYKEYAEWQQNPAVLNMLAKQEEFWLKEFKEEIPKLDIPTDYPRPQLQSFEGNSFDFEFNAKDMGLLKKIAYTENVTLFMAILAIFNIFLAKLNNQEDIVVGMAIAGRRHSDLEKIVGMFVNTLALRNFPSGGKTFKLFLNEVREKTIKAFENQDYQFEDIVEKVDLKRDMSRNPLFDVMFGIQNYLDAGADAIAEKETGALKIGHYPHKHKISKFDFSLDAVETDGQLNFRFTYCTKLFREDSIVKFINYFIKIITLVIKNPEIKISDIAIISEEEKKHILYILNNTEVGYPQDMTIHYLFEEQVEKTPDKIASVYKEEILNYRELNKKANQLANLLISKGIGRGAFVPMPIDHSLELLISFLAILKAGAAFVPLDVRWPIERVKIVLDDLGGEIVLANEFTPWTGNDMNRQAIMVSLHKMQGNENNPQVNSDRETPLYVMYTSGSTGRPKGVIIPQRGVINRLYWMNDYFGRESSESVLQTTRYVYDSVVWQFFWPLLNGGRTVILPSDFIMRADSLTYMVETHRLSIVDFVPSIFNTVVDNMVENPQLKEKLTSLRDIILGGEEIIPTSVYKFMKIFPQIRITNLYGPTETTIGCVYHQVTGSEGDKIPIGRPISNVKIFVMDKYKNLLPVGLPGEIYIAGIGLGLGYLDNVEKTDSIFERNPITLGERIYRTGDLGRWSEQGRIDFFGRIDFQVKIRGYRIELGEIEGQLLKYEDIKEAIVLCREETGIDKYLCAYIVSDKKISVLELKEYLLKHLPTYMIPSYFIQIDKIPLTSSGKIDRNALNLIKLDIETGVEYVAPKSEVEKKIADIWKEVLRLNDVGIFDNFFELGGNSLNIVIVNNKIKNIFDKDIPIVKMFTYPTINSLANYINQKETNNTLSGTEIKKSVNLMEEAMQMLIGDENE